MKEVIEAYKFASRKGDIVEMPWGKTGVVEAVDFEYGGCSKVLTVRHLQEPGVSWYRRLLTPYFGRFRFRDDGINNLNFLGREEVRK